MEKKQKQKQSYQNGIERGMLLGVRYGTKQGIKLGKSQMKVEIAKKMLKDNYSLDEITKYIELSEDEIKSLII